MEWKVSVLQWGGTGTQYNSSREQFHYIYQIIPILGIFSEDIMGKCTESYSLLHDLQLQNKVERTKSSKYLPVGNQLQLYQSKQSKIVIETNNDSRCGKMLNLMIAK